MMANVEACLDLARLRSATMSEYLVPNPAQLIEGVLTTEAMATKWQTTAATTSTCHTSW